MRTNKIEKAYIKGNTINLNNHQKNYLISIQLNNLFNIQYFL